MTTDAVVRRLLDVVCDVTGLQLPEASVFASNVGGARSALMQLTGPRDGAPLPPRRDHGGRIAALCGLVRQLAYAAGGELDVDPTVVAQRAAMAGLSRNGNVSAGGSCRILRTVDGHIAVNLARPADLDLLPAWIGCEPTESPWDVLQEAVANRPAATLVEQGQLLGIPVSRLGEAAADCMPLRFQRMARPLQQRKRPWLVLDFSSLWAGPLCGHLLSRVGARVIKIESTQRPDGARGGPPAFFDLLHGGQEMLAVDFRQPAERERLRALMRKADLVIEASRPRAFAQLGFAPAEIFRDNPGLSWVSITGYGRDGPRSHRVGFGDDVAVAAGLVAFDAAGNPNFIGDAIADPLAGLAATAGAFTALVAGGGWLVDAPMVAAAAFVASAAPVDAQGLPSTALAEILVTPPARRAAVLGAHTEALFAELSE